MPRRVPAVLLAAALAPVLSAAVHAGVNDPFPGDTVPPPPNLWSVAGYAFERQQEGPYRRGEARSDTRLHTWIGALRVARSFQVAGFTVAPALAFTYAAGRSDQPLPPTGQTGAKGFGDLRFGGQAWLVNEPSLRRYVSLTGLVLAPTGKYDERDALSIGENRWRYLVQAAWHEGLGERWNLEIVSEAAWSGLNTRYLSRHALDQDPGYSLTGFLRYRVDDSLQLSLGGQVNTGGQTRLTGPRKTITRAPPASTPGPRTRSPRRCGRTCAPGTTSPSRTVSGPAASWRCASSDSSDPSTPSGRRGGRGAGNPGSITVVASRRRRGNSSDLIGSRWLTRPPAYPHKQCGCSCL